MTTVNIATYLERSASAHPEQIGIVEGSERISYASWLARCGRLARALAERGVGPGDRVGLLLPNSAALLESLFAVFMAGAVVVPLNVRAHPREYGYMLEHSGARALIYDARFEEGVRSTELSPEPALLRVGGDDDTYAAAIAAADHFGPAVPRGAGDLAWLFYTSGTSGRPKGAMVTHGNLAFMTDHYPGEVYAASTDDRALHAGPLTHGSGLWAIPLTAAGATQVVPQEASFSPDEIFRLIEAERITKVVFVAPTMLKMLLASPACAAADCSSLRFLGYGGAPIHPDDLRAALERWGPVLCNVYGQGESPMTITLLSPRDHAEARAAHPERLLSVGRPRKHIEVAVLGDDGEPAPPGAIGEVCIKGPVVMAGYWRNEEATAEALHGGWYHTGDLGSFDSDGFLYLKDRLKDLVITGGANVYPREVEDVILQVEGVQDVAVIGVPDRHWGESVVAVVVPEADGAVTSARIVDACRAQLASYKKPRRVVFVDALPRSAYGKVLKRELVRRYADDVGVTP